MGNGQVKASKRADRLRALHHVSHLPIFSNLDQATTLRIASQIHLKTFEPGQLIVHEDSQALDVLFLIDGEVAVTRDNKLVTLLQSPDVLGLISVLDGQKRTATLEAFTEVNMARIEADDFRELLASSHQLKDNLMRSLAAKLRHQYGLSDHVQRHFDDFFRSPHAQLVKGPYVADPFPMYLFLMEGDEERVAKLLPSGLSLIPGVRGRYLLTFNFFEAMRSLDPEADGRRFAYHETSPFVPCIGPGFRPGLFIPELYPDNFLAITLGRELYGFPKRFAQTILNQTNKAIDLVLARQLILRAQWAGETTIDLHSGLKMALDGLWPSWIPDFTKNLSSQFLSWTGVRRKKKDSLNVPVFVHKQMPNSDGTPAVSELKEVPFQITQLSDFSTLEGAEVRFLDGTHFLHGSCLGAFRIRLGLRFAEDRVLRDYRSKDKLGWKRW